MIGGPLLTSRGTVTLSCQAPRLAPERNPRQKLIAFLCHTTTTAQLGLESHPCRSSPLLYALLLDPWSKGKRARLCSLLGTWSLNPNNQDLRFLHLRRRAICPRDMYRDGLRGAGRPYGSALSGGRGSVLFVSLARPRIPACRGRWQLLTASPLGPMK